MRDSLALNAATDVIASFRLRHLFAQKLEAVRRLQSHLSASSYSANCVLGPHVASVEERVHGHSVSLADMSYIYEDCTDHFTACKAALEIAIEAVREHQREARNTLQEIRRTTKVELDSLLDSGFLFEGGTSLLYYPIRDVCFDDCRSRFPPNVIPYLNAGDFNLCISKYLYHASQHFQTTFCSFFPRIPISIVPIRNGTWQFPDGIYTPHISMTGACIKENGATIVQYLQHDVQAAFLTIEELLRTYNSSSPLYSIHSGSHRPVCSKHLTYLRCLRPEPKQYKRSTYFCPDCLRDKAFTSAERALNEYRKVENEKAKKASNATSTTGSVHGRVQSVHHAASETEGNDLPRQEEDSVGSQQHPEPSGTSEPESMG